jgi:glutamate synthase domain-containing protein 2
MKSYTKKDLQKEFDLSDNTVISNLKACRLNTAKQKYNQQEYERFTLCRKLFEEGKNAKEVEQYFIELDEQAAQEQQSQEVQQAAKPKLDPSAFASQQAADASNTISNVVAATLTSMVSKGVQDITPYIPAIVVGSINNHLNADQILEEIEQIYSNAEKENPDAGAVFFTQIIETQTSQQQQLLEGQKQPQLPQASPKSSTDSPLS